MRRRLPPAVFVFALLLWGGRARADDFLTSSPGALSKSHAALDDQASCDACHEPDRSISAAKCLGCHDHGDLKARIAAGKGFHASTKAAGRDCKLCHQEHRGRNFDLMGWRAVGGEKGFDHALAGWPLQGKHAVTACAQCHKTTDQQGLRTYLGADRTCGGCHTKHPHGAMRAALTRCDRCHSETVWTPQKAAKDFDHDDKKDAAMALDGSHADVPCSKCHPKAAFKLPAFDGQCSACHQSPHDGQLFGTKKCTSCHSPKLGALDAIQFDHRKQAGYALLGEHATLACAQCHTAALGKRAPSGRCESCHAADNKHGDRFAAFGDPPVCTTCHSQRGWKSGFQFNHETSAGFALTGKHAKVACRSCHRGAKPSEFERFDVKANGCMSCHQHRTAHGGKFKNDQCLGCHSAGGEKKMRTESLETFHGEGSKFPLRNAHAKVACELCHVNDVYADTPRECGVSCHEDSLHRGSLGPECSRCHEAGRWTAVRFDHAADTTFQLRGKHAALKTCDGCHPQRAYDGTPTTCGASGCHQRDDLHAGQLGASCDRCHREDAALLFRHDRDTGFALENGHQGVACKECHATRTFRPVPETCGGCHAEPVVHKGRYGTACERCHTTRDWKDISALHDVGDFSLTGAHDRVACRQCHEKGEQRRGSGNLCITCHRDDDIHQNSLSPRCGECHTQRAFAPARFDHLSVGCNLIGLHRTLPCADCHKNGNFGAVSPLCVSCHRDDAAAVSRPDHGPLVDCGRCHNPDAWVPAKELGGQSICR